MRGSGLGIRIGEGATSYLSFGWWAIEGLIEPGQPTSLDFLYFGFTLELDTTA